MTGDAGFAIGETAIIDSDELPNFRGEEVTIISERKQVKCPCCDETYDGYEITFRGRRAIAAFTWLRKVTKQ